MRARAREINIFNMSLLDILCGALGAFCFMMLVLLPYYKPPGSATDLHKQEMQTEDLLKEMEKLKEAARDSALARQMTDVIQRLEEQIKQLQGEVNQFATQNDRLTKENQNLAARNQKQAAQLGMRRPFFTIVTTYPPQDVDIYLWSDGVTEDKQTNPSLEPSKTHHVTFFAGDQTAWWPDHGVAVWMTRDTPAGVHYKLYVKIPPGTDPWSSSSRPVTIKSLAVGDGWKLDLPDVVLNSTRFWTVVGTLTVAPDEKMTFKEATGAERDAEWSKLSKGASPPPQPSPTGASAAPSPNMPFSDTQPTGSISADQRRALIDQIDKARKQREGQKPSASPAPTGSP